MTQWKESFWNFNQERICGVGLFREAGGGEKRKQTI